MLLLSIILTLAAGLLHSESNRYLSVGQQDIPVLVVLCDRNTSKPLCQALEELPARFEDSGGVYRILVVFLDTEAERLPEPFSRPTNSHIEEVIERLSVEEAAAVVYLSYKETASTVIHPGFSGDTVPRWFLEQSLASMDHHGLDWTLADTRLTMYRLGWLGQENPSRDFHQEGYPAIWIQGNQNIIPALEHMARSLAIDHPTQKDSHYLLRYLRGRLVFIGEEVIVILMIISFTIILSFVFIFSFLHGKQNEQRLRDLAKLWWLPFTYLVVTTLCLIAGQAVAQLIVRSRFSDSSAWALLPRTALMTKFAFAWFFITIIFSLNQVIHFPSDSFVYGYIASMAAMINIFVFSAMDFSLSILFLTVYLISIAAYRISPPVFHLPLIALMALPFFPYAKTLLLSGKPAIESLFLADTAANLRIAFFLIPFQLLFARFFHRLGLYGRRQRFYLPVNLFVSSIPLLLVSGFSLFYPAWSPAKPLEVTIHHVISEDGEGFALPREPIRSEMGLAFNAERNNPTPEASTLIPITTNVKTFLDKQLIDIDIHPLIPASRIEVSVFADRGTAVYSANSPFELSEGGRRSLFVSPDNPDYPYTLRFSTDRQTILTATIRILTAENPWQLEPVSPGFIGRYVLDCSRTVPVGLKGAQQRDGE